MWHSNVKISGVWANDQERNAFIYLVGVGWRKLKADTDSAFLAMLSQCLAAKTGNRPVNANETGGLIAEVYVF